MVGCLECSSYNYCINCTQEYPYNLNNKCFSSKPLNSYCDPKTNVCFECPQVCSECDQ